MAGIIGYFQAGDNHTVVISKNFAGDQNILGMEIPFPEFEKGLAAWKSGKLVQDAFLTLDSYEREFLMTGTTKVEWDEMFPPEED
jgi:hypothetical protein